MMQICAKPEALLVILSMVLSQCKNPPAQNASGNLENIYWQLTAVDGKTVITPAGGREIYMTLSPGKDTGALKGYAGCNGLGGDYTVDGRTIQFQPITTRIYCEAQMEMENLFIRMLDTADNYRIRGKTLILLSGEQVLGKFEVPF